MVQLSVRLWESRGKPIFKGEIMSRTTKSIVACALALGAALGGASSASADVSAGYWGQGTMSGDGGLVLSSSQCDASGDGYLLWVFTATKGTTATITGPWGTADMTKSGGGAFKYVSDYYPLEGLVGHVSAWSDQMSGNVQLVISHGCADDGYPGGGGYGGYGS